MDPKNTNPATNQGQNPAQPPAPAAQQPTPTPAQSGGGQTGQGQAQGQQFPQGAYPPQGQMPQGYPPMPGQMPGYPPMYDPYAAQQGYYPPQGYPQPGAYPPGYPPMPPQGAMPGQMPGAYPPGYPSMPPQGMPQGMPQGYPPMPAVEDTTPANFQLGTKFPAKLNVAAPKSELKFDDEYFIRLLAGSISLSKDEKKKIIESIPKLKQAQIDELIRIFEEEKQKFAALSKKHMPQLEKLAQQHFDEWMELEHEWDQSQKKTEDTSKADAIRKSLGL